MSKPSQTRPRRAPPTSPPKRRSPGKKVARKARTPAVLIVQCDTGKLRRDRLAMADSLAATAAMILRGTVPVELVEGTSAADLQTKLSALKGKLFTTIVVIGHTNEDIIRIGSDKTLDWPDFPALVKRFRPQSVVIVGCKAGSFATASQFFARIPSVKHVYASPVNAKRVMVEALHVVLPLLATAGPGDFEVVRLALLAKFVVTNEVMVPYTRAGWLKIEEHEVPLFEAFDGLAPGLIDVARDFKRWLTT